MGADKGIARNNLLYWILRKFPELSEERARLILKEISGGARSNYYNPEVAFPASWESVSAWLENEASQDLVEQTRIVETLDEG